MNIYIASTLIMWHQLTDCLGISPQEHHRKTVFDKLCKVAFLSLICGRFITLNAVIKVIFSYCTYLCAVAYGLVQYVVVDTCVTMAHLTLDQALVPSLSRCGCQKVSISQKQPDAKMIPHQPSEVSLDMSTQRSGMICSKDVIPVGEVGGVVPAVQAVVGLVIGRSPETGQQSV